MFAQAYKTASAYTLPLLVASRHESGTVRGGIGTFIVINPDGWALTCAHMFEISAKAQADQIAIAEHKAKVDAINASSLPSKKKRNQIRNLRANAEWITNWAYLWGGDTAATVAECYCSPTADLALLRLENTQRQISSFPVFGNPGNSPSPGTSLCKLGFPLHDIEVTFDPVQGFKAADKTFPAPLFPMEGILTRGINLRDEKTGIEGKYIETSTTALRGQSGGPVFDVSGTVWGIQSHVTSYDMGMVLTLKRNGRDIPEHQVLNVGVAVDISEIKSLLDAHGVTVQFQTI